MFNRFLFGLLLGLISFQVFAGDKPEWRSWPNGERLQLGVSGYLPSLDTTVAIGDASETVGTVISFERIIGTEYA